MHFDCSAFRIFISKALDILKSGKIVLYAFTRKYSRQCREVNIMRVLIVLFSLLLCSLSAYSQTPKAKAFKIKERIRINGKLDEPAWQSAQPIGDLIQVLPKEDETPSEKTEVRIMVDDNALYFGIICYDRTPSAIVSTQLTRDADLTVDDHIAIVIDPFFDQRNGYLFMINPEGARTDGQISNNADMSDTSWDGIWDAAARISERGWEAEIIIPFKTLRFKPEISVWGLNVQRVIKRYNETDRWSEPKHTVWLNNMSKAGQLDGIPPVNQGKGLDIRPYGVVRKQNDSWKYDGGFDISKNLAPNINASLTVNTDFAETEVDNRQINLTRFDLFYPEKRPFFLEGAGVFSTASEGMAYDLIPFFSRRIGLYAGREVPILVGGKIAGRQSGFNIGLLDVQTDSVNEDGIHVDGQNLLVARVSHDIWRQSYIGAIFTRGNPGGGGDNNLIGVDARLATSEFHGSKNLSLNMFLYRTDDQRLNAGDYAAGFSLDYPNDIWWVSFGMKQIGDNFEPALGFVPRAGIRKADLFLSYGPRPEKWGIRKIQFQVMPNIITTLDNRVDNWSGKVTPVQIEFDSGEEIEFNFTPGFERLPEEFEISPGIVLPPGSYNFTRYAIEGKSASKRPWVLNFTANWGGFYSGTRRNFGMGVTLKPNPHLLLDFAADRNDIHLKEGDFFTQLFSVQGNYNFTPNISWANLMQYDSESRIIGVQSRFRWILKPGNDLFLVLNRGWYRTFDHEYISSFDRATIKLAYTFRF